MTVHVVVTCSKRKRKTACAPIRLGHIRGDSVERRAENWIHALGDGGDYVLKARDLYVGEQWSRLRELENDPGRLEDVRFWVLSAGYGLVSFEALVRPYDATFSRNSSNSIFDSALGLSHKETVRRWWRALSSWSGPANEPRSLDRIAATDPSGTILVAASPGYLGAIREELHAAAAHLEEAEKLMIFSGGSGVQAGWELEFDGRLRRRFGGSLMALNVNVLAAAVRVPGPLRRTAVQEKLNSWMGRTPPVPQHDREPLSDDAVRRYISGELDEDPRVKWSPLLRKLRDDLGHACEQKRFRALFMEVAQVTK